MTKNDELTKAVQAVKKARRRKMSKKSDFLEFVKVVSEAQELAPICVRCGVKIDLITAYSRGRCANCKIDFEDTMRIAQHLVLLLKYVLRIFTWSVPGSKKSTTLDRARAYLEQIKDMGDEYDSNQQDT